MADSGGYQLPQCIKTATMVNTLSAKIVLHSALSGWSETYRYPEERRADALRLE
jgi:hypothetical protein